MALLLGRNREQALRQMFKSAGPEGYGKSTGLLRKRLNALLWRSFYRPKPS